MKFPDAPVTVRIDRTTNWPRAMDQITVWVTVLVPTAIAGRVDRVNIVTQPMTAKYLMEEVTPTDVIVAAREMYGFKDYGWFVTPRRKRKARERFDSMVKEFSELLTKEEADALPDFARWGTYFEQLWIEAIACSKQHRLYRLRSALGKWANPDLLRRCR